MERPIKTQLKIIEMLFTNFILREICLRNIWNRIQFEYRSFSLFIHLIKPELFVHLKGVIKQVKAKGKFSPLHAMKAYSGKRGMSLDQDEWSASRSDRFISKDKYPVSWNMPVRHCTVHL